MDYGEPYRLWSWYGIPNTDASSAASDPERTARGVGVGGWTRPDARQLEGLFMALLLVSEAYSGSGLGTLESIPSGRDWGEGQEGSRKIAHESIINRMTS